MHSFFRVLTGVVLAFGVGASSLAAPMQVIDLDPSWSQPKRLALNMRPTSNTVEFQNYVFSMPSKTDVMIEVSTNERMRKGYAMLVDGRVLMVRNLPVPVERADEVLDEPMLAYQLALKILSRTGVRPADVTGVQKIDVREMVRGLAVKTRYSSAAFDGPWVISGELRKLSDLEVRYDLKFTFRQNQAQAGLALSGVFQHTGTAPFPDEKSSVKGWDVFAVGTVGPVTRDAATQQTGWKQIFPGVSSLGDLRKLVAQQVANRQASEIRDSSKQ